MHGTVIPVVNSVVDGTDEAGAVLVMDEVQVGGRDIAPWKLEAAQDPVLLDCGRVVALLNSWCLDRLPNEAVLSKMGLGEV